MPKKGKEKDGVPRFQEFKNQQAVAQIALANTIYLNYYHDNHNIYGALP